MIIRAITLFVCGAAVAYSQQPNFDELMVKASEYGVKESEISINENDTLKLLAERILSYHVHSIHSNGDNWPLAYRSIKRIYKDFPALKHPQTVALMEQLKLTIDAPPAPANGVESDLIDWSKQGVRMWGPRLFDTDSQESDPLRRLVLRGLSALTELDRLADDQRITAHTRDIGFRGKYHWFTLGELAKESSVLIHGSNPKARDLQEDAYFLSAAFSIENNQVIEIHDGPVYIISRNFPASLAALCDHFYEMPSPEVSPSQLANGIAVSALPKAQQVELLATYAAKGALIHRRPFLQQLCELDPERGATILRQVIAEMPKDVSDSYFFSSVAALTHSVMQVDSVDVWQQYLSKTRECAVGLRMEILSPMNYIYIKDKNRAHRLGFLAAFLNDKSERTIDHSDPHWEGPSAGLHFPTISVQNFAALSIASIVDIKASPDKEWTPAQWDALREQVATALKTQQVTKFD